MKGDQGPSNSTSQNRQHRQPIVMEREFENVGLKLVRDPTFSPRHVITLPLQMENR